LINWFGLCGPQDLPEERTQESDDQKRKRDAKLLLHRHSLNHFFQKNEDNGVPIAAGRTDPLPHLFLLPSLSVDEPKIVLILGV